MAIKKSKTVKGIEVDYWKIINCDVRTGMVILGLFNNRDCGRDKENVLFREVFEFQFPTDVETPLAYAYEKIKESKLVVVTPAVEEVKDEEGNIITPAEDAVMEESNEWALAEDC